MITNSQNLWINEKTNKKFTELLHIVNQVAFEFDIYDEKQLIQAGKKYYCPIFEVRDELENLVRKDVLTLYNFSAIRKKNSKPKGMQLININKQMFDARNREA